MLSVVLVLAGIAIPQAFVTTDAARSAAAARYLSSRLMLTRAMAAQRGTAIAIRFDSDARGVFFDVYQDGNHNGVRIRDIDLRVDRQIEQPVRLFELFPGVDFGLAMDGQALDPIQLGGSSVLTFTPAGSATSGSLYIRSRKGSQYAVRVLGATGRTRIQRYDERERKWIDGF